MNYKSVAYFADKWGVSERSVRNYCAIGKLPGAVLEGKNWLIPEGARRPGRRKKACDMSLLSVLKREKKNGVRNGIYHKLQVDLTYNSNHIEGSRLSHEQTRYIYETNTIGISSGSVNVDDILEAANHFRCISLIIERAEQPLSEKLIKELHFLLKCGTSDSAREWFAVGEYKKFPNEVGGKNTSSPESVKSDIRALLAEYNSMKEKSFDELLDFHYRFECIHPFQDGNGRVGRLILFKECLRCNIIPFIIDEELKYFYYRGLSEWEHERGYLRDTCLTAQDRFRACLDYFRITY